MKQKQTHKKYLKSSLLISIFLIMIIFLSSSIYSESPEITGWTGAEDSEVNYFNFPSMYSENNLQWTDQYCEQTGMDFLIELSPESCSPTPVPSNILEEQDVPVMCRLDAIKINPLIEIPYINRIVVTSQGASSDIVSLRNVFYPSRSNTGLTGQSFLFNEPNIENTRGVPTWSNLGYLILMLKRKPSEREMPDSVITNLTAKIYYDVAKSYGITSDEFVIPIMTDDEWRQNYKKYGFWNGKGFIRVLDINDNKARIAVYDNPTGYPVAVREMKVGTSLGDSDAIKLPSFYCLAALNLDLKEISLPKERTSLIVDGDLLQLSEGEKFLDDECYVKTIQIDREGYGGTITINCKTERGSEDKILILSGLNSEFIITDYSEGYLSSETRNAQVGNGLVLQKKTQDSKESFEYYYLGYSGINVIGNQVKSFVVLFSNTDKTEIKNPQTIKNKIQEAIKKVKNTPSLINSGLKSYLLNEIKNVKIDVLQEEEEIIGKETELKIKLSNVEGPKQAVYSKDIEATYLEAKNKYEDISHQYSLVEHETGNYYGVVALEKAAKLAEDLYKYQDVIKFNQEIINNYKDSDIPEILLSVDNARAKVLSLTYSSSTGNNRAMIKTLSGQHSFSLIELSEPSYNSLKIELMIDGSKRDYTKGDSIPVGDEELLILEVSSDGKKVTFQKSWDAKDISVSEGESTYIGPKDKTKIKLQVLNIDIKKEVKIGVGSLAKDRVTEVNFTIAIGIEKRNINFTPEQLDVKIANLDKTIKQLTDITNKIGNITKTWNKVCTIGGTALWGLNLATGLTGESLARQIAMDAWTRYCTDKANWALMEGNINTVSKCYYQKRNEIDSDVGIIKQELNNANNFVKEVKQEDGVVRPGTKFLGLFSLGDSLDNKKFITAASNSFSTQEINFVLTDPTPGKNPKKSLTVADIKVILSKLDVLYTESEISSDDIRDLKLKINLMNKCSESSSKLSRIYCEQLNLELFEKLNKFKGIQFSSEKQKSLADLIGVPSISEISIGGSYLNTWVKEFTQSSGEDQFYSKLIEKDKEVINKLFTTNREVLRYTIFRKGTKPYVGFLEPEQDNRLIFFQYFELMEKDDGIGLRIVRNSDVPEEEKTKKMLNLDSDNPKLVTGNEFSPVVGVQEFDFGKCFNTMNPEDAKEIKFWDSGNYEGFVAVMPIEEQNGWYFATKSYGTEGSEVAWKQTGELRDFWICNVGPNGKIDFNFNTGPEYDDVYCCVNPSENILINLQEERYKKLIQKAETCAKEASNQYNQRTVKTSCTGTLKVGEPPTLLSGGQCEDFMSPGECNLLYNLCDPVICPSSRCNFDGRYPVKDVAQTGIIGSLLLCSSNFGIGDGGVAMPVCLTGLTNGLDALNEAGLKQYRDCLQTYKDEGKFVGICDATFSLYKCNFLWGQLDPIIKTGLPAVSNLFNKGGGGEYLLFNEALKASAASADYLTQSYGKEAFDAFKVRSSQQIGTEICKRYISLSYPDISAFFEDVTSLRSPYSAYWELRSKEMGEGSPESQYSVTIILYAGKDRPATYNLYMKKAVSGGYYYDFNRYPVPRGTGVVPVGGSIQDTIDFIAPTGYGEICLVVNGEEQCVTGTGSTSFAIDEWKDYYLKEQILQDIKTSEACKAGEPSLIPYPTLNLQSMAETTLQPQIYKRNILRICKSTNPGGSGEEGENYLLVGYCDNPQIGCWVDVNSIKESIIDQHIEDTTLSELGERSSQFLVEVGEFDNNDTTNTKLLDAIAEVKSLIESLDSLRSDFYDQAIVIINNEETDDNTKLIAINNLREKIFNSFKEKELNQRLKEIVETLDQISYRALDLKDQAKAQELIADVLSAKVRFLSVADVLYIERTIKKEEAEVSNLNIDIGACLKGVYDIESSSSVNYDGIKPNTLNRLIQINNLVRNLVNTNNLIGVKLQVTSAVREGDKLDSIHSHGNGGSIDLVLVNSNLVTLQNLVYDNYENIGVWDLFGPDDDKYVDNSIRVVCNDLQTCATIHNGHQNHVHISFDETKGQRITLSEDDKFDIGKCQDYKKGGSSSSGSVPSVVTQESNFPGQIEFKYYGGPGTGVTFRFNNEKAKWEFYDFSIPPQWRLVDNGPNVLWSILYSNPQKQLISSLKNKNYEDGFDFLIGKVIDDLTNSLSSKKVDFENLTFNSLSYDFENTIKLKTEIIQGNIVWFFWEDDSGVWVLLSDGNKAIFSDIIKDNGNKDNLLKVFDNLKDSDRGILESTRLIFELVELGKTSVENVELESGSLDKVSISEVGVVSFDGDFNNKNKLVEFDKEVEVCGFVIVNGKYYSKGDIVGETVRINDISYQVKDFDDLNINAQMSLWNIVPKSKHSVSSSSYSNQYYQNLDSNSPYWADTDQDGTKDLDTIEYDQKVFVRDWCGTISGSSKGFGTYWFRAELVYNDNKYSSLGRPLSDLAISDQEDAVSQTSSENKLYPTIYKGHENVLLEKGAFYQGISANILRISIKSDYKNSHSDSCIGALSDNCDFISIIESYKNVPFVLGTFQLNEGYYGPELCIDKSCFGMIFGALSNTLNLDFGDRFNIDYWLQNNLVAGANQLSYQDIIGGVPIIPGDVILVGDLNRPSNELYWHTIAIYEDSGAVENRLDQDDLVVYALNKCEFNSRLGMGSTNDQLCYAKFSQIKQLRNSDKLIYTVLRVI